MKSAELGGKRAYIADMEVYDGLAIDPAHTILDILVGIKYWIATLLWAATALRAAVTSR